MKLSLCVLLGLAACTAPAAETPCYGVRPATAYACRSDWSGIDAVEQTSADAPPSSSPACACPADTACHRFPVGGDEVVACALNAGGGS